MRVEDILGYTLRFFAEHQPYLVGIFDGAVIVRCFCGEVVYLFVTVELVKLLGAFVVGYIKRMPVIKSRALELSVVYLKAERLYKVECRTGGGAGTRYARVKSLLAWSMTNGLGDAVLSIPCPWEDAKWEKRWPNLIEWAMTLA